MDDVENVLLIKNLNIMNAYYDQVSQSFRYNSYSSVIKFCRLKPILFRDENESKNKQYLPLIDFAHHNEILKISAHVENSDENSNYLPIYFFFHSSSKFLIDNL
jgi:hypothetical protein